MKFISSCVKDVGSKNWLIFFVGLAFFFTVNHYRGIVIDGPLYLLQVIHSWYPERFVNDVSFAYGNQDSFSLFSPLYGLFIKCFGVAFGSLLTCFLFQFIWGFSFLFLIKIFAEKYLQKWMALPLSLFCMGIYAYGMPNAETDFLMLVEGCAISRLGSVSLGVLGLAFLANQNKKSSLIFFVLGSLMHPLMAGWGFPLWFLVYYPKTRLTIVTASLLLPLTMFFDKVPFAQYPDGWLVKPLYFRPSFDDFFRFLCYGLIFGGLVKKSIQDTFFCRLSVSLSIVLAIAFYWWCWGGFGEHIFLYQVQTFRVEWICQVLALPTLTILCYNVYRTKHVEKNWNTHDLSLLCFLVAVLLPVQLIEIVILGFILLVRKEKKLPLYTCPVSVLLVTLDALLRRTYFNLYMEGMRLPMWKSYGEAARVCDSVLLLAIVIALVAGIYLATKKRYALSMLFFVFCTFPAMLLLPLVLSLVWLKPSLKKWQSGILLFFALLEGVSSATGRTCLIPLPSPFYFVLILWVAFLLCVFAGCVCLKKIPNSMMKYIPLFLMGVVCIVLAVFRWDLRPEEMKLSEKQMDEFVASPLFPQASNQGKILYAIGGFNAALPRLQFLNGGYFDENSLVGGMFIEKQYREGNARRNKLYYKKEQDDITDDALYRIFVNDVMMKRDSLMDRVYFLCENDDVDFLVSDMENLPLKLENLRYLKEVKKNVFLYSCQERI